MLTWTLQNTYFKSPRKYFLLWLYFFKRVVRFLLIFYLVAISSHSNQLHFCIAIQCIVRIAGTDGTHHWPITSFGSCIISCVVWLHKGDIDVWESIMERNALTNEGAPLHSTYLLYWLWGPLIVWHCDNLRAKFTLIQLQVRKSRKSSNWGNGQIHTHHWSMSTAGHHVCPL